MNENNEDINQIVADITAKIAEFTGAVQDIQAAANHIQSAIALVDAKQAKALSQIDNAQKKAIATIQAHSGMSLGGADNPKFQQPHMMNLDSKEG